MESQKSVTKYGGTMRLGSYPCVLEKDSLAHKLYKNTQITERHRHRYEFNNKFMEEINAKGMRTSGKNPESNLVEIVELTNHPFFIGVQFHPELKSTPENPHPLFKGLIEAALNNKK
jgi:CTP synthase